MVFRWYEVIKNINYYYFMNGFILFCLFYRLIHADLSFGKCVPINGISDEDYLKQPLDEDASNALASMLEELRGAGLGWNDLFVQCRLQGALFALRENIPMPSDLCAHLVPDHKALLLQDPSAIVQFSPPNNDYADEIYFPPMKKGLGIGLVFSKFVFSFFNYYLFSFLLL